jgi:hypothetical protein
MIWGLGDSRSLRLTLLSGLMVALVFVEGVQSLLAQCAKMSGMETIEALGQHKQVYRQFPIDVNGYEKGTLVIDITVSNGESSASFNLFPQGTQLPADGGIRQPER